MQGKLPVKTLILWQIRLFAIAFLPLIVLNIFSFFNDPVIIALYIWFGLIALLIFIYLPLFWRGYKIIFQKGSIVIKSGVFVKVTHIMPFSRLVYAKSFLTPVSKLLGLSALSLKAARSSVLVPELNSSDVNYFLDFLAREDGE